jgi:hypothetical protein
MKKINESKNSKKFNYTINKVHSEMESVKRNLSGMHLKWKETYSDVYCYDLQFKLKSDIESLESKYELLYDLSRYYDDSKREGQAIERVTLTDDEDERYVCEFRKLEWVLSNSNLVRTFDFVNTGEIKCAQIKRKRTDADQSFDYYAAYDVNSNDLSFRVLNNNTDMCFINSKDRRYSMDNKMIIEDEESISLVETKEDNSELRVELDRAGNVIRKYLTLGDYNYVVEDDKLLYAFMKDEAINIDAELWIMVMFAMNEFEIGNIDDKEIFNYINVIKSKMIYAIKSIKGDVPIDGLSKRLDIALSMISTKKIIHSNDFENKVLRRR